MSKWAKEQIPSPGQIAQVAQDKIATVSDLLRLLMIKEQMSKLLVFFSKLLNRSFTHKNKQITKKFCYKIIFFCRLFCKFKNPEQFAHSLFFKELYEWIAQVTHDKRATVSKWFRLLTKNEPIACFFLENCSLAHHLLIFGQKRANS